MKKKILLINLSIKSTEKVASKNNFLKIYSESARKHYHWYLCMRGCLNLSSKSFCDHFWCSSLPPRKKNSFGLRHTVREHEKNLWFLNWKIPRNVMSSNQRGTSCQCVIFIFKPSLFMKLIYFLKSSWRFLNAFIFRTS